VRVTFDDAFHNIHAVVPVLLSLGIPIEVFVCTGFARDGAPLPARRLTHLRARS